MKHWHIKSIYCETVTRSVGLTVIKHNVTIKFVLCSLYFLISFFCFWNVTTHSVYTHTQFTVRNKYDLFLVSPRLIKNIIALFTRQPCTEGSLVASLQVWLRFIVYKVHLFSSTHRASLCSGKTPACFTGVNFLRPAGITRWVGNSYEALITTGVQFH